MANDHIITEGSGIAGYISKIQIPGSEDIYEIHDERAVHSASDLGLSSALAFRGKVETQKDLEDILNPANGDVYLVTSEKSEYVWIVPVGETGFWEPLGNVHDAASSKHTHMVNITKTLPDLDVKVSGKKTTVTEQTTKLALQKSEEKVSTVSALPSTATFTTTVTPQMATVTAEATGGNVTLDTTSVVGSITEKASVSVLAGDTGFEVTGGAANTQKLAQCEINNPTTVTQKTVVKKTADGSVDAGEAATWSAAVSNHVLTFNFKPNKPTGVVLPTLEDEAATYVTTTSTKVGTGTVSEDGSGSDVAISVGKIGVQATKTVTVVEKFTATPQTVASGTATMTQPTINVYTGAENPTGEGASIMTGVQSANTVTETGVVAVIAQAQDHSEGVYKLIEADSVEGAISVVKSITTGEADAEYTGTATGKEITINVSTSEPSTT